MPVYHLNLDGSIAAADAIKQTLEGARGYIADLEQRLRLAEGRVDELERSIPRNMEVQTNPLVKTAQPPERNATNQVDNKSEIQQPTGKQTRP